MNAATAARMQSYQSLLCGKYLHFFHKYQTRLRILSFHSLFLSLLFLSISLLFLSFLSPLPLFYFFSFSLSLSHPPFLSTGTVVNQMQLQFSVIWGLEVDLLYGCGFYRLPAGPPAEPRWARCELKTALAPL